MARTNKKGTSFSGLGLEKAEEKKLKAILIEEDKSGKQLMRTLLRKYIQDYKSKS